MAIILDGTLGITTPGGDTSAVSYTTPIVKSPSSLTLQTNGTTTAVTIDTSQNVGIGTASPGIKVDVNGGMRVQSLSNPSSGAGMELGYDGTQGVIQIYSNRATQTGVPLLIGTGQIKFPATQSASSDANTLDDYEEGAWTPTFSSVSGSLTSYTSGGYYIKIGGLVTIYGWVRITTAGTASGGGRILNLPFSASNITGYYRNQGACQESQNTGLAYQFFPVDSGTIYILSPTNGAITWTAGYTYPFQLTYQST